jgi:microcystin-dependent protein
MEPYIGQIQTFAYNFTPRGWAECRGQLMPVRQYTALFSLLGTTYGGDGINNFALPDLRYRDASGHPFDPELGSGNDTFKGQQYMRTYIAIEGVYPSRE